MDVFTVWVTQVCVAAEYVVHVCVMLDSVVEVCVTQQCVIMAGGGGRRGRKSGTSG